MLADFRTGKFNVLVATSIGEEGLDIPQAREVAVGQGFWVGWGDAGWLGWAGYAGLGRAGQGGTAAGLFWAGLDRARRGVLRNGAVPLPRYLSQDGTQRAA